MHLACFSPGASSSPYSYAAARAFVCHASCVYLFFAGGSASCLPVMQRQRLQTLALLWYLDRWMRPSDATCPVCFAAAARCLAAFLLPSSTQLLDSLRHLSAPGACCAYLRHIFARHTRATHIPFALACRSAAACSINRQQNTRLWRAGASSLPYLCLYITTYISGLNLSTVYVLRGDTWLEKAHSVGSNHWVHGSPALLHYSLN